MMEATHSFGTWVRRRRKALDLTQKELAARAACSVSTIKKIERDSRRPSRQLAEILARCLAIPERDREQFLQSARGLAAVDRLPEANQIESAPDSGLVRRAAPAAGNLPVPTTPLFGRRELLADLTGRLSAPGTRLVTLSGLGGAGKSRLALEAARAVAPSFPAGAWFVSLAGVDKTDQIGITIAMTLKLALAGPLAPEQQLIRLLRGRRLLLILDNVEQLLPEGAEIIAFLIESLPELTILVTSRERLRLQAELTLSLKGIAADAARALFVERARRSGDGPELESTAAVTAIDDICAQLEGLPLAVELAASWARLLTPAEILAELSASVALLAAEHHDRPARHRSMQAVFAGTWARLDADEQSLLASLSVFPGSFTRDAVESICGGTLAQLARLHDHSLLQRDRGRFYVHDVIRHFASAKLRAEAQRRTTLRDRHAAYYCQQLNRIAELFRTGGMELTGWEQTIDDEIDNIRQAWRWLIDNGQPQRLHQAGLALWLYQDLRGQARQGLEMSREVGDSAAKIRAAVGQKHDESLRCTEALALIGQGAHGMRAGQRVDGQLLLAKATALLAGLDAPVERVALIGLLGPVALQKKEGGPGQRAIEDILALARRENNVWGTALALNFLGLYHFSKGRIAEARNYLLEAVSIWRAHPGLTFCQVRSLVHVGLCYHALGDYKNAIRNQQEAVALAEAVRDFSFVPLAHCNLAFHYYAQDDLRQARSHFHDALNQSLRLDLHASSWHAVLGLGLVAAAENEHSRAVTLLTWGLAKSGPYLPFLLGEPQRVSAELQRTLAPAAYAEAESQAWQMDLAALTTWL